MHNPESTVPPRILHAAEALALGDIVRGLLHHARSPLQTLVFANHQIAEATSTADLEAVREPLARSITTIEDTVSKLSSLYDASDDAVGPLVVGECVERVVAFQEMSKLQIRGEVSCTVAPRVPAGIGCARHLELAMHLVLNHAKKAIDPVESGAIAVRVAEGNDRGINITVQIEGAVTLSEGHDEELELAADLLAPHASVDVRATGAQREYSVTMDRWTRR